MGLLTGGLNGRRFRITTPLPSGFRDQFLEQVRANAFADADDASDAEPRIGWVSVFDPAISTFELNDLLIDRYLALSLRADTKKIQGAYLKIAVARRCAEVMAERGLERLSKSDREAVEEALTAELHRRALPSVATTDFVWDIQTGEVTVFSTSEGPLEQVRQLAKETFGVALHPERLVDWLFEKLSFAEVAQRVDEHLPGGRRTRGQGLVVDGWQEQDPLEGHELVLGSDFLTWLWLQSEASDGLFRVVEGPPLPAVPPAEGPEEDLLGAEVAPPDPSEEEAGWNDVTETLRNADLTLWIDGRLKLRELCEEDPATTILLGVAPSTTPEARETLSRGKRPVEAQLGVKVNDLECSLLLQASPAGVTLSGLKLPFAVKDGREEKVLERMVLLEVVQNTLKKLFQQFFLARTSPAWAERVERWLAEELGGSPEARVAIPADQEDRRVAIPADQEDRRVPLPAMDLRVSIPAK